MKRAEKTKYSFGIKGRIVLYFTAFVLLMLVIIFVVQIALVRSFYSRTRLRELDKISSMLSDCAGSDNMEERAYSLAANYKICVLIFETGSIGNGSETVSVESSPVCIIHHLPDNILEQYYEKALANGGKTVDTFGMYRPDGTDDAPEPSKGSIGRHGGLIKAVSVNIADGADGKKYVVFVDSEFTPYKTVDSLITYQFIWLSGLIIIFAVIAAALFSVNISKPLTEMNEAAKKLAKGDYETGFKPKGYRETIELAETLNYAAEEIRRSDALQKELVANVSHDLRTPLTMISGYAEVMRDIPGENTPENVQVIIDEAGHLTDLVNDMLDLSKIEAGTKKPEKTVFNLTEAIGEVIDRYSRFSLHDSFDICFEADGDVSVCADKTMIIQTVYNLVNNAINYAGDNKMVTVRQKLLRDAEDNAGQMTGKSCVRISVTDYGEGIPPEKLRDIWERYYKVDRSHKRAHVGTGLGLSIVKNNLQLHGARYGVESTLGKGSTFWFELETVADKENS